MSNYYRYRYSARCFCLFGLLALSSTAAQAQMVVDRDLLQRGMPKGSIRAPAMITNQAVNPILAGPHKSVSYVAQEPSVVIYSKNVPHVVTFTTPVELPDDAPITNISWKYSLKQHPQGIEVQLCWQGQALCNNITRNEIGNTTMFNGKHAGSSFNIQYVVRGPGLLGPPVAGGANQLIVTYAVPLSEAEMIEIK
jgi:hypothetical protein